MNLNLPLPPPAPEGVRGATAGCLTAAAADGESVVEEAVLAAAAPMGVEVEAEIIGALLTLGRIGATRIDECSVPNRRAVIPALAGAPGDLRDNVTVPVLVAVASRPVLMPADRPFPAVRISIQTSAPLPAHYHRDKHAVNGIVPANAATRFQTTAALSPAATQTSGGPVQALLPERPTSAAQQQIVPAPSVPRQSLYLQLPPAAMIFSRQLVAYQELLLLSLPDQQASLLLRLSREMIM